MSVCPSTDLLQRLLTGQLPDAEEKAVDAHVEACPHCQQTLEDLTTGDVGERFAGSRTPEQPAATPEAAPQMDNIHPRPLHPGGGEFFHVAELRQLWRMVAPNQAVANRTEPEAPAVPAMSWPTVPGYEILGELGRGGMGVVYKARQLRLNRLVALKILRATPDVAPDQHARFVVEGEALARLQHPNVVQIYDVGFYQQQLYFALELVEGGSLAEKLAGQPMPVREAAALLACLAEAMHDTHARGILHRDLKPGNVLLTPNGVPKVTDFGLAKTVDVDLKLTRTGDLLGTPAYMAPEQALGQRSRIGPWTDIYALGVILYEVLTGRPPFLAATYQELLQQVTWHEPVSPRQLQPQVPRDLETICLKCLQKEPSKRYGSAGEFGEDLRRFLAGEPIQARAVGRGERLWRWCRRNPVVASLTAAVFLSLALATGTASVGYLKTTWALDQAEHQKGIARRARYLTDMQLAAELWQNEDGTARAVRDLLEAHLPQQGEEDLRDFAWRYQWNLMNRKAVTFEGHDGLVAQGAFAPDGRLITVDSEHQLRIWDTATRRAVSTLDLTAVPGLWRIDLANDGKAVAIGTTQGTVRLLEPTTGQELRVLTVPPGLPVAVRFLGDSRTLLTLSREDTGQIWQTATGDVVRTIHRPKAEPYNDLSPSPDGTLWVTRTGPMRNWLQLWDPRQGTVREASRSRASATVNAFAFSPDGKTGASGTFMGQVILWNLATGEATSDLPLQHGGAVMQLAFAPGGSRVAGGGQNGLITVSEVAQSGRLPRRLKGHTGEITFLAFSADGNTLASGSTDGTAKLWDLTLPAEGRPLPPNIQPQALVYSPDGRWLATARRMSSEALLMDAQTGRPGQTFGEPARTAAGEARRPRQVVRVAFAPDGNMLATGDTDSRVQLWDVASGRLLNTLIGKPPRPSNPLLREGSWEGVASLAFSPDGVLLAAGFGNPNDHDINYTQVVQVWEAHSGHEVATLEGHRSTIPSLAFAPDGLHLATASHDRTVKLWEVGTWRVVRTLTGPSMFKDVAFAPPNGQTLAAACYDGTIRRWEADTGRVLPPFTGHAGAVNGLAFSPDGKTLASASWDRTVRLWDVASGRNLRLFKGHTYAVVSVVFSPDGNTVAAVGMGGRAALWEAASPQAVAADLAEQRIRQEAEQAREALCLRTWLTLDTLPLTTGQTAADGLEAEQIAKEAGLRPGVGDVIQVGDQKLEWQENQDADPVFGRIFEGKYPRSHRVAYGVCYLRADEQLSNLRLRLRGKDEQAKVYLNGQQVLYNLPDAGSPKEQTSATITLARGTNVLVVKIVNKRRLWRWCLELTDRNGQPVTNVQVRHTP
jgi:WD40 repeat protein